MTATHFTADSPATANGRTVHVIATSWGLVVIGGQARWWWPTAEQRLARELTRLGCHVTFVHVPKGRFVSPLVAAARERARPPTPGRPGTRACV